MAAAYVVVRLFSGRPDPCFDLTAKEVDDVRTLVRSLPGTPELTDVDPEAALGYRGMLVHFGDGDELLVFHRLVEVISGTGAAPRRWLDPSRQIEQVLVVLARQRLGDQLPWAWIVGEHGTAPNA